MTAIEAAPQQHRVCPSCLAVFRYGFARCPLDGTKLEKADRDPLIGQVLTERYVIEECIGQGGMGRVYRARHTRMSRFFAIKVLYGDLAADSIMRTRCSREAEIASCLSHPNLVSVVDFGDTSHGLSYLAMELVDGPLLSELLYRQGRFGTDRVAALLRQMASGLEHAHSKGLVHRDFKPENVIIARIQDGEIAKIMDFGIARLLEYNDSKQLTAEGALLGTPVFMSPEQASGAEVDVSPDNVSPDQFRQQYLNVHSKLKALSSEYPDSDAVSALERKLLRIDYGDVYDRAKRSRSYRKTRRHRDQDHRGPQERGAQAKTVAGRGAMIEYSLSGVTRHGYPGRVAP
ncbi:MAG: serine/threonine protein kinase [Proteobacteria bacterium]|nr:serine/threonine protein kinase [Pseudomonadota bacterium]